MSRYRLRTPEIFHVSRSCLFLFFCFCVCKFALSMLKDLTLSYYTVQEVWFLESFSCLRCHRSGDSMNVSTVNSWFIHNRSPIPVWNEAHDARPDRVMRAHTDNVSGQCRRLSALHYVGGCLWSKSFQLTWTLDSLKGMYRFPKRDLPLLEKCTSC